METKRRSSSRKQASTPTKEPKAKLVRCCKYEVDTVAFVSVCCVEGGDDRHGHGLGLVGFGVGGFWCRFLVAGGGWRALVMNGNSLRTVHDVIMSPATYLPPK